MTNTTTSENGRNVANWERLVSAGLGALLVARSWRNSWTGTAVGAALTYRGLSGHCHVYEALGHSSASGEEGTVSFSRSVTIAKPAEEIFRFFLQDVHDLARLTGPVIVSQRQDDGTYRFSVSGPAGTYRWTARLLEIEPGRSLSWETIEGDIDNWGTIDLSESARGTVLKVSLAYRVPGGNLTATLARLTGDEPHETLERALWQLKSHLEVGEAPTIEGQPMGAGRERLNG
ncbi:MAG: SRPBCC family protein [Vulcanimicrobiota bacterium]